MHKLKKIIMSFRPRTLMIIKGPFLKKPILEIKAYNELNNVQWQAVMKNLSIFQEAPRRDIKHLFLFSNGNPISGIKYYYHPFGRKKSIVITYPEAKPFESRFYKATGRTPMEELLIRLLLKEKPRRVAWVQPSKSWRKTIERFERKYKIDLYKDLSKSNFTKLKPLK